MNTFTVTKVPGFKWLLHPRSRYEIKCPSSKCTWSTSRASISEAMADAAKHVAQDCQDWCRRCDAPLHFFSNHKGYVHHCPGEESAFLIRTPLGVSSTLEDQGLLGTLLGRAASQTEAQS